MRNRSLIAHTSIAHALIAHTSNAGTTNAHTLHAGTLITSTSIAGTLIARTLIAGLLIATASAAVADTQPGAIVRLYDIGQGVHGLPELAPDQLPNEILTIGTIDLQTGQFGGMGDNFYDEVDALLTIESGGKYTFRLISDDGAKLWIDGKLVIDHDGLHGATPKDGAVELTGGVHKLHLAHFDATADEQLTLRWSSDGKEFTEIPPAQLSHDAGASRETAPGTKRIIPPLRRGRPGDGTPLTQPHPAFGVSSALLPGNAKDWIDDGRIRPMKGGGSRACVAWIPGSQLVWAHQMESEAFKGDVVVQTNEEVKRLFVDDGSGADQGVVFRFSRVAPWYVSPTKKTAFEMLAVRAMTNGFEIEFTKPLDPRVGWEADSYYVEQWPFGGRHDGTEARRHEGADGSKSEPEAQAKVTPPRRDGVRYPVKSASVSADRKHVFLEIENLKPSHVVYIRLLPPCLSEDGELPWSTEAWYTLNAIPKDRMGKVLPRPKRAPQNFLTDAEKAEGWRLLFDGKTTKGWRGFRKDTMPDGWQVVDDSLVRVGPAGDIVTMDQYQNFELKLEWRISPGGNSGILFHVSEDKPAVFETGPEMQVLDNTEHADGKNPLTSAGADYALHAPTHDVTKPVGLFNKVRLVVNGPHVEHWLNGEKIVEYELWTDAWRDLVAGSKFNAWPGFGLNKTGYIALQDHGDKVWYRNIKIRALPAGK